MISSSHARSTVPATLKASAMNGWSSSVATWFQLRCPSLSNDEGVSSGLGHEDVTEILLISRRAYSIASPLPRWLMNVLKPSTTCPPHPGGSLDVLQEVSV